MNNVLYIGLTIVSYLCYLTETRDLHVGLRGRSHAGAYPHPLDAFARYPLPALGPMSCSKEGAEATHCDPGRPVPVFQPEHVARGKTCCSHQFVDFLTLSVPSSSGGTQFFATIGCDQESNSQWTLVEPTIHRRKIQLATMEAEL